MGLKTKPPIDLTLSSKRSSFNGKIEGDLLLVGTPVYGGTISLPFWESLKKLKVEGKWAVPVAVYGNRSPDTTIEEVTKLLRGRGFKILATATFISKHSFASKEHPWAVSRPDEKDMLAAEEFGRQVAKKAKSNLTEISVPGLLLAYSWGISAGKGSSAPQSQISNAMVEEYPAEYHKNVLARAKGFWWVSPSNRDECTKCMNCVNSCPTDAIDAETLEIDDESCIRCMACVDACPVGVMNLIYSDKPTALDAYANLDKIFAVRKEPKFFL